MILSRKLKLLFVRPTKTGTTSIISALTPWLGPDDIVTGKDGSLDFMAGHLTPQEIAAKYPEEWGTFRRITVVRNPWDFEVSKIAYWNQIMNKVPSNPTHWLNRNFKRYAKAFAGPWDTAAALWNAPTGPGQFGYTACQPSWWPWSNERCYFADNGDVIEYDTILRFETLSEDFACLGYGALPVMNASPRRRGCVRYYDQATKQAMADFHAKEIEEFGYGFRDL